MAEKVEQSLEPSVKPNRFEKVVAWFTKFEGYISLIFFALVFVYAICMSTPLAKLLYVDNTAPVTLSDGSEMPTHYFSAALYNVSGKNNNLMLVGLIGCLISLMYNLFRNNQRRIYYVTNYVIEFVLIGYLIFTCVMISYTASYFGQQYSAIDFKTLNATEEQLEQIYPDYYYDYMSYSLVVLGYEPMSTTTIVPLLGYLLTALVAVNTAFTGCELFFKRKTGTALFKKIYSEPSSKVETEAK